MNLNDLTLGEIKQLKNLLNDKNNGDSFYYEVGKQYVVRTVTMIYLGTLKAIGDGKLLFKKGAWIPDTSRWNEFLKGTLPVEMEPYTNDYLVYEGGILDVTEMTNPMEIKVI